MRTKELTRLSERLRRLKRDEFLDRSRQAFGKRLDAALGRFGYDFAKNARTRSPSTSGNFFFTPESVDSILELLRQRLPGRAEQIIQEAEQVCRHRFDLLGYSDLDYGSPLGWDIDWHRDAVHGKRAPRKAFYRVPYLDYAQCGDSKVIWELNRHQHLVTLAKAYRLTHDLRYVDEILRQKRHWLAENPYPFGINWASSLEVAFRSLSWLWTYYLLHGSPGIPDLREEWLRGFALHGRHIERYLSTYFSPNTHLLGEAVALFFVGVLCPELGAAERWKSLGWEIVLREMQRQVRADGFHFGQSTYYHVYALDLFLHSTVLAGLNGIPAPKSCEDTLGKMLTALSLLGRNGPPPRFGDDDGGRLFDPRRNRSEHLLDPLATGAILFRRQDYKASAGGLREETLWLLGPEGVRQWDALAETVVPNQSAVLPAAGLYLLSAEKTQLVVDAGPLGAASGGHGHADALSVTLQSHGYCPLIDPGTCEYTGAGGDRALFRGTSMHNTLRVDGADQAETAGPFAWRRLTQSGVEQWIQGKTFDLLVASHDGYQQLQPPVTHRRWVISFKNGMFLVRDAIAGQGRHRLDIPWHLGPDLEPVNEDAFRVKGTDLELVVLHPQEQAWTGEVRQQSWSPVYGLKAPMTVLYFSADVVLPAEFAVLLIAPQSASRGTASLRRLACAQDSDVSGYGYEDSGNECSFFFSESSRVWRAGPLSSDAGCVCHRRAAGTSEEQLIFCHGTFARIDDGVELRFSRHVAWAELIVNETGRRVFCSDSSMPVDPVPEPA